MGTGKRTGGRFVGQIHSGSVFRCSQVDYCLSGVAQLVWLQCPTVCLRPNFPSNAMARIENEIIVGFGPFSLSRCPRQLLRGRVPVHLRPQALRLLSLLVDHAGETVSREQIRETLWPERHVDFERGTHLLIREIREALHDDAASPAYIETVPRRGYRFVAKVRPVARSAKSNVHAHDRIAHGVFRKRASALGLAALCVAMVAIATALFLTRLSQGPQGAAQPRSAAYLSYAKGNYLLEQGRRDDLGKSVALFEEALIADTSYAPAYAGLADALTRQRKFDSAERYALKAVSIDPLNGHALVTLGIIAAQRDWDWDRSVSYADRAIASDPENANAFALRASLYLILGDLEQAIIAAEAAYVIDPLSALIQSDVGWIHYVAGNFVTAKRHCEDADDLAPNLHFGRQCLIRIGIAIGDQEYVSSIALPLIGSARDSGNYRVGAFDATLDNRFETYFDWRRDQLDALRVDDNALAELLAAGYAEIGDHESAAELISRATDARGPLLPLLLRDPVFVPLRDDHRYARALETAGMR